MNRRTVIRGFGVIALGALARRAQAQAPGAHQFVLTGVVLAGDGRGTAWLQEPTLTQNQPLSYRVGDTVGPYRLTGIFEDRVELESPAGRLTVPLYGTSLAGGPGKVPQTAPTPAPAVPPGPTQPESAPLYHPSRRAGLQSFIDALRGGLKK